MKRFLVSAAAAAAIGGAGFAAGRCCKMPSEGPAGISQECRVSTSENDLARLVELMARRAIRQTSPALRQELGAGAGGDAEIRYLIAVSEQGTLKVVSSITSCGGARCPGDSELPELIGLLLASEFTVGPRSEPCMLEIGVSIPIVERPDGTRKLIFPPQGKGVEL